MFGFYHWFKFGFYYFAVASIMEIGSRMETQRKLQIRVFRIGDELDVHLFKKSINKLFNWNSDLLIRWDKLDDAPLFQHWQGCLPNILLTCSLNCSSFFQHLSLNEWPFVCVYIFAPFWHFNLRTGTNKLFFETFAALLIACFGRAHLFFFSRIDAWRWGTQRHSLWMEISNICEKKLLLFFQIYLLVFVHPSLVCPSLFFVCCCSRCLRVPLSFLAHIS